ncbi:MAG: ABC transporter ATP-binding protein, partial [Clostridia bacterium]|nr:ABC transporter ATP-binding protein [Clostridia bacterium]
MKRWFKYVKPHLRYFILGPLCMIIEVIGEVLMPIFLAIVINGANNGTLTVGGSIGTAGLMILTAIIMMLGGVGGAYFGSAASVNFAADLRNDAFSHIQKFSFSSIDKFSTGSLITRVTNDVTQLQNFVNMLLRMCLRSPGMLIGAIIMAVSMRPDLSVVLLVTVPLMLISIVFIISKGFPRFARVQTKIDSLNNTVQENITNVRVVKSFVREDFENDKFKTANRELKSAGMSAMKVMIFMGPVMNLFMYASVIAIIWFGHGIVLAEQSMVGGMRVGDLSAFITYA